MHTNAALLRHQIGTRACFCCMPAAPTHSIQPPHAAGISNCLTIQHLVAAQRTVFYRQAGSSHALHASVHFSSPALASAAQTQMAVHGCSSLHPYTQLPSFVLRCRERAAGMYSVYAFSLAQLLVEVPYLIVQAVVYVSMVYW